MESIDLLHDFTIEMLFKQSLQSEYPRDDSDIYIMEPQQHRIRYNTQEITQI